MHQLGTGDATVAFHGRVKTAIFQELNDVPEYCIGFCGIVSGPFSSSHAPSTLDVLVRLCARERVFFRTDSMIWQRVSTTDSMSAWIQGCVSRLNSSSIEAFSAWLDGCYLTTLPLSNGLPFFVDYSGRRRYGGPPASVARDERTGEPGSYWFGLAVHGGLSGYHDYEMGVRSVVTALHTPKNPETHRQWVVIRRDGETEPLVSDEIPDDAGIDKIIGAFDFLRSGKPRDCVLGPVERSSLQPMIDHGKLDHRGVFVWRKDMPDWIPFSLMMALSLPTDVPGYLLPLPPDVPVPLSLTDPPVLGSYGPIGDIETAGRALGWTADQFTRARNHVLYYGSGNIVTPPTSRGRVVDF